MVQKRMQVLALTAVMAAGVAATVACSDSSSQSPNANQPSGDAGTTNGPDGTGAFTPPADPGAGGFLITASGEDIASKGFEWTSDSKGEGDPPAFTDGWAISYEHILVTIDKIRVNADPDKDEGNPKDVGAVVASVDGPFAVDLTAGGNVPGKSGEPDEKAVSVAAISKQANGSPFDPAVRYAFSYDFTNASANAKFVNLNEAARSLYSTAVQKGWSMVLVGKATYKGPAPAQSSEGYEVFSKIPKTVNFTLGLKNPSSYINCRNTDLTAVGDEFPRGIQASADKSTAVQITLHTDHVFWNTLNVEGSFLHFDPIAANASTYGTADSTGVVSLEDLASVDVLAIKTKAGEPLPWRSLVSDFTPKKSTMQYELNGTSFSQANSFAAFLSYSAASGGHMNAQGECEIQNNFTP